jgi:hypothetical protein
MHYCTFEFRCCYLNETNYDLHEFYKYVKSRFTILNAFVSEECKRIYI